MGEKTPEDKSEEKEEIEEWEIVEETTSEEKEDIPSTKSSTVPPQKKTEIKKPEKDYTQECPSCGSTEVYRLINSENTYWCKDCQEAYEIVED